MSNLLEVRHVSVSVARAPHDVYRATYDVSSWVEWAHGLGTHVTKRGDAWIARGGPLGEVTVRVAPENDFGVLDHDVTLPTGQTVRNPLRVLPNGAGSELVFSVFRQPEATDESFEQDAATVEGDLLKLKALLEQG